MNLARIGQYSFIGGIILAVLAGFVIIPSLPVILFILGLIVGFLNIKEKESASFLISVVALLLIGISGLQLETLTSALAASILNNFIAFVAAAGLVVAIKQVLVVGR